MELGRSERTSHGVDGADSPEAALTGVCGVLSLPTFPAGAMVFFISWRVVAETLGAAHLDLLGAPGGAADAGRTMVMSPAAPDCFSVIFRFGADDGARAIGATDDVRRQRRLRSRFRASQP